MPNTHRLDAIRHATFLSEQRKDPVTRKPFRAGDEIVICAGCRSAFSVDSWNYLDGTHDGQTGTLAVIEQGPVAATLRGPRLRLGPREPPPSPRPAPQRNPHPEPVPRPAPQWNPAEEPARGPAAPNHFGAWTLPVVVALLSLLVWLVSLAVRSNVPRAETPQAEIPASTNTAIDHEDPRSPEPDESAAWAERARVQEGLIGEWLNGESRLTITNDGSGFAAVYRFPDSGPFSRGEAHQTMRGELLASNDLKLTNIYHGKLANPLDYFSGDFDGEVWITLSEDGTSVTARLQDGRSLVLARQTGAVAPAITLPETEESSEVPTNLDRIAELRTTAGDIVIRFFPEKAPNHVRNFIALAEAGFYDGTNFHRVIPGFMIQGGDPLTKSGPASSWGSGGSAATIAAEFNDVHHRRGIVSMARAQDPDSASSQFFICVDEAGFLDGQYTVFGEVLEGMDVVDAIVRAERGASDRPRSPTTILKVAIRSTGNARDERATNAGEYPSARAALNEVPLSAEPVRAGGDVSAPSIVTRTEPRYTEVARKARISGTVILECVIDSYGDVRSVRVLKGLPFGLDKAAADAVATWKFRPGRLNGTPVDTVFNLTVNFKLNK